MTTLAERIRHLLTIRGISARELDRRSGLAAGHVAITLRRLEKNPQAEITLQTVRAMAKGGEVSERWLLTGQGAPADDDIPRAPSADDPHPMLRNVAGYADIRAVVERVDPSFIEEEYAQAEEWRPYLTAPLTPAVLLAILRLVREHNAPGRKRRS